MAHTPPSWRTFRRDLTFTDTPSGTVVITHPRHAWRYEAPSPYEVGLVLQSMHWDYLQGKLTAQPYGGSKSDAQVSNAPVTHSGVLARPIAFWTSWISAITSRSPAGRPTH
jgi:hypothetical protein